MSKVIVIGGGASGLVAAINAARGNNEVIILEKNNSCGKKILVTGNGKCNYFNQDIDVKYYHSSNDELLDIIINNTNKKLVLDFFDSIGIIPNIRNGYYYPHSNQAITIVNALLNEVNRLGISVFCNTKVIDINKKESIFEIRTDKLLYKADKVIVATGSKAYYNNDVNSYELVGNLVNNVIKPLPALVQLKIDSNVCKKWSGVRVNSLIKLYEDNKYIKEEIGELMLTNYGVSGICAMQLSSYISRGLDEDKREELFINFVYDIAKNSEELLKFLDKYNKNHNYRVREICDNLINYKLGNAINGKFNDFYYSDLSKKQKYELVNNLTNYKVKIVGTNSYKEAQTCSGGVCLKELDLNTMEVLSLKNLYVVGEIIDVNGDCGGYNLGFAWISGILAGGSCNDKN